jgi:hypothetical protein
MTAHYIVGDSLTVLRTLPDASVDLALTSPPFLALRSYLPADHPNKAQEMGSEPTPGAFIDGLLDIVEELRRVLAPHGSLCFELGDTYSGSAMSGQRYDEWNGSPESYDGRGRNKQGAGWPLDKSLALIPESFRWALAYGRNPFTGRTIEPWRVRNVIRWHRPNPPVGALSDKFRCSTSDMVVACMSRTRYFDLDSVRQPAQVQMGNPAGAPPLDTWIIPTQPYAGSHYATWPEQLCIRPIKAMCPTSVCRTCGQPRRRIVETVGYESLRGATTRSMSEGTRRGDGVNQWTADDGTNGSGWAKVTNTIGWSDCGHNNWRAGVVLDPFAGSGTTGLVATGHGRDFIGVDLDDRNAELAIERIGPLYMTVERYVPPVPPVHPGR